MNKAVFPAHCSDQFRIRWQDDMRDLIGSSAENALIDCCAASFSFSSHLQRSARHFAHDIPEIWAGRVQQICEQAYETLCTQAQNDDLDKAISYFRNRCHFAIACGDLWGVLAFEQSLSLLSKVAEQAVQVTSDYLVSSAGLKDSQWIILALGKLGAEELNYSSDLDLICLFDTTEMAGQNDAGEAASIYISLTKKLVNLLSASTEYGAGWRIDLRLRPAPSATAICLSVPAAISYYESLARSWERAAFIRARPIAGNIDKGRHFLKQISSFVWRRSLDYTIIDDLAIMLQQKATPADHLGFDVKKGSYGIRHIELFCHILQLLAGGRNPEARSHHTATALASLAEIDWLEPAQADQLTSAYYSWRKIEHRLQYWQDAHTHRLPRQQEEMTAFAAFAGCPSISEFTDMLVQLQKKTEQFSTHPVMSRAMSLSRTPDQKPVMGFINNEDHDAICQYLSELGFVRVDDIANTITRWQEGQIAATRSEKARQNLGRMLPRFLADISHAHDADASFFAFVRMIEKQNAGAQLFALFAEHPELSKLVGESISKSPIVADYLSRAPDLLDLLLENSFFTPLAGRTDSCIHLPLLSASNPDIESRLEQVRMYKRESDFTASMHMLHQFSTIEDVQALLTNTADRALELMCRAAIDDVTRQVGKCDNFNFAVIGLGRLGSQKLTLESDLDLVFIYSDDVGTEDNAHKMPSVSAKAYATKLAQRITNFMTVKTAHGNLYQLDMRLRPDGNSGALAVDSQRLDSYFTEQAWSWEKLSFRKARAVFSFQTSAKPQPEEWISDIVKKMHGYFKQDDLASLVEDITKMRAKLQASMPPAIDLKKRAGGFLDAEFLMGLEAHPQMSAASSNLASSAGFIDALAQLERIKQQLPVYGISTATQLPEETKTRQEISEFLAPSESACATIKQCLEIALDTAQSIIDAR